MKTSSKSITTVSPGSSLIFIGSISRTTSGATFNPLPVSSISNSGSSKAFEKITNVPLNSS